jgi:hypothetical protein
MTTPIEPRFFIDHDMIHDRASGKHVCTERFQFECHGGSLEATCAMMNDIFNYGVITCIRILGEEARHAEECLAVPYLTQAAQREAKCWHDGVIGAKKKLERRLADTSALDSYPLAIRQEADAVLSQPRT